MKKRRVLKAAIWSIAILFSLLILLLAHIQMVKPKYDNNELQLSRIDFKQTIDSTQAVKIRSFVCHLPGVKNAVINHEHNTLVIGYLNNLQTADNLFEAVVKHSSYNAVKFVPEPGVQQGGCPVGMDKNSLLVKMSDAMYNWFN